MPAAKTSMANSSLSIGQSVAIAVTANREITNVNAAKTLMTFL